MNRSKLDELSSELLLRAAEKADDSRQASNLARGAAQRDRQIGVRRTGKYSKVKQREDSSRDLFVDRVIGVLLEMRLDEIEYDEQGNIKHDPKDLERVYRQRQRTATLHLYDRPDSVPLPPGVKRRRKKTPPPPPAG